MYNSRRIKKLEQKLAEMERRIDELEYWIQLVHPPRLYSGDDGEWKKYVTRVGIAYEYDINADPADMGNLHS